jgi:hypothetical protein
MDLGTMPRLSPGAIEIVLKALAARDDERGAPVYVSGGQLYRLEGDTLAHAAHPAAAPYAWPLAHDVRPAAQALGSGGCTDCHQAGSPIFFGKVDVLTPVAAGIGTVWTMDRLTGVDAQMQTVWGLSFQGRPYFKIIGFAVCGLMAAILLVYGLHGLRRLLTFIGRKA